jgi:hypothetical protein
VSVASRVLAKGCAGEGAFFPKMRATHVSTVKGSAAAAAEVAA